MPRQPRLDAPGTLHHVIGRGIEGTKIFRNEGGKRDFLSRVPELCQAGFWVVYAWALMDTHFHLLVRTGNYPLAKSMRKILQGYAWSNYAGYTHLRKRQPFVHYSEILDMAGGGDSFGRRRKYEQFVMDGVLKDMNLTFWKGVRGQAVLGSDDFVDWIYERFSSQKDGIEVQSIVKV